MPCAHFLSLVLLVYISFYSLFLSLSLTTAEYFGVVCHSRRHRFHRGQRRGSPPGFVVCVCVLSTSWAAFGMMVWAGALHCKYSTPRPPSLPLFGLLIRFLFPSFAVLFWESPFRQSFIFLVCFNVSAYMHVRPGFVRLKLYFWFYFPTRPCLLIPSFLHSFLHSFMQRSIPSPSFRLGHSVIQVFCISSPT